MLVNSIHDRGEVPPTKRRRIDNGNDEDEDAYAQITLDDLRDPEAMSGITLQMQDRERYFEGQLTRSASEQASSEVRFPPFYYILLYF
jgi:transcription initiation factor TFIIH subunit 1